MLRCIYMIEGVGQKDLNAWPKVFKGGHALKSGRLEVEEMAIIVG